MSSVPLPRCKRADEKRIRENRRQRLKSSFEEDSQRSAGWSRGKRVSSLQLPDYYRSLSNGEKHPLRSTIRCLLRFYLLSLVLAGSCIVWMPTGIFLDRTSYPWICRLGMLAAVYYWTTRFDTRDGVLNEDGARSVLSLDEF